MKRAEVIYNPNAGRGRAAALALQVAEQLAARGWSAQPTTIGDFLSPSGVIERGCDVAVTLGGDGTVRAIVQGLVERFGESSPPVAVLAMGTANLVARHLDLPWNERAGIDRLVAAVVEGNARGVDLPVANGKLFLLMCSVGFDAQVVHEVAARRRGPITKLDYVPAFARSVLGFRSETVEVHADGRRVFGPAPGFVVVANAAEYGTGFSMNPTAVSDDGVLDLTIFDASERKHLLATAFHAVTQRITDGAAVLRTAKSVVITGDPAPAQVDGEAFGHVPIEIGLLPYRQRFIVPA